MPGQYDQPAPVSLKLTLVFRGGSGGRLARKPRMQAASATDTVLDRMDGSHAARSPQDPDAARHRAAISGQ